MESSGFMRDPVLVYLRAYLGVHMAALRSAWQQKDRGASAVELAIISAVILVIAAIVLAAVRFFVKNESNKIKTGG